jgi:hypothetical protein
MAIVDAELVDWADISHHFEEDQPRKGQSWETGGGILIGNGASINAHEGFGYNSLYEVADLSPDDEALFDEFSTTNFERVLAHLNTTMRVNQLAGYPVEKLEERYASIKNGLVDAVNIVHPNKHEFPDLMFTRIQEALVRYERVFSTNYDLLVYWSFADDFQRFLDYLWGADFTPADTSVRRDSWYRTRVLWLHGALHLYQSLDGVDCKLVGQHGNPILDQFASLGDHGEVPLFVAEGTADDKMSVINSSPYLSFALKKLRYFTGPLVVFGSQLQDSDAHLVEAIKESGPLDEFLVERKHRWDGRKLAFAVYPEQPEPTIASYKARIIEALECDQCEDVYFFNSTTHPLGVPDLSVFPEPDYEYPPTPAQRSPVTDALGDPPGLDELSSDIDW